MDGYTIQRYDNSVFVAYNSQSLEEEDDTNVGHSFTLEEISNYMAKDKDAKEITLPLDGSFYTFNAKVPRSILEKCIKNKNFKLETDSF